MAGISPREAGADKPDRVSTHSASVAAGALQVAPRQRNARTAPWADSIIPATAGGSGPAVLETRCTTRRGAKAASAR